MEIKLKERSIMKRLSWLAAAGTMFACATADAASQSGWRLELQPQSLLTPADRAAIPFTDKGRAV
jgi:hypothetical protein